MSEYKNSLRHDFFDELEEIEKSDDAYRDLGALGQLCENLEEKDKHIKKLEENLAKEKEIYKYWSTDLVPDLMDQFKMTEIKLKSGRKITIKEDLSIRIKENFRADFLSWMIKRGYQSLIKNKVEVQFPKEGRQSARRFVTYLKRYYAGRDKCSFIEKEDIHPQTLKAWAKDAQKSGTNLPDEFLNIYNYKIAKLK